MPATTCIQSQKGTAPACGGTGESPAPSIQPLPPSGLTLSGQYTATKVAASRKMLTNAIRMREGAGAPVPCFLLNHHHTLGLRVEKMLSCSNTHSTRKMQAISCITSIKVRFTARNKVFCGYRAHMAICTPTQTSRFCGSQAYMQQCKLV